MNDTHIKTEHGTADSQPVEPLNIFFRLLIPSTGLFVFFMLVWMVALLGDSPSPVARWFAQYGMWPIGLFFILSMVVGVLALGIDNRRNRQSWSQLEERLKDAEPDKANNAIHDSEPSSEKSSHPPSA